jgi:hypothetical protein
MRCKSCTFWWPTAEGTDHEPNHERSILGQCRRHAPPAHVTDLPDHGRHYPSWATNTSMFSNDDGAGSDELKN